MKRFWALLFIAASIFLISAMSPPSLMDDVDAVQANIARTMLYSGDWVTARLDGIAYLEKAPLKYWVIAIFYFVFGVHDWVARLPIALSAIALCWLVAQFGRWAFSTISGLYAGLVLATCVGLWLFTRILIPDVMLTLAITASMWSLLRCLDPVESKPRLWSALLGLSLAAGFLLKGLIAVVFPCGASLLFLIVTGQWRDRASWRRLRPVSVALLSLAVALPWVVLATIRNPPYIDLTMRSEPGQWHGFFWFFFLNEHLFRFLNMRYPRDYDTVPLGLFWLGHLLWLFPWSLYLPALVRLSFRPADRAGRARLLCLCWIGVVLLFFSFSTTQEYYSMPCYPALALLLGDALASADKKTERLALIGTRIATVLLSIAGAICLILLFAVWNRPTHGDIGAALSYHYSQLSLGRAQDLTLAAFGYLRTPLFIAGSAMLLGALAIWRFRRNRGALCWTLAIMMAVFFQAARLALITFDPYLSSRPLAQALLRQAPGKLIVDDQYYVSSSVFFYAHPDTALLLNGRKMNLEYGSYAPGAPTSVFINDEKFRQLWNGPDRMYLVATGSAVERLRDLARPTPLHVVTESGGKFLMTNQERSASGLPSASKNAHRATISSILQASR